MAKWMGESVRQSSQPNCVSPFSPSFLYSSVTHVGASVVLIHLLPAPKRMVLAACGGPSLTIIGTVVLSSCHTVADASTLGAGSCMDL